MEKDKTAGLRLNVEKAAKVREMCQTPGFQILEEHLEKIIRATSRQMIDVQTDDEKALTLRREGQVWVALHKLLRTIMQTGQFSARNLENLEAPSTEEGQAKEK